MKIQTIAFAAALLTGTAFAAAPNDAPGTTSTTTTTTTTTHKHHKTVKTAQVKKQHGMHHAMHHAAGMHHDSAMGASAPQTDVNDSGRDARMEEALAKYRQSHS